MGLLGDANELTQVRRACHTIVFALHCTGISAPVLPPPHSVLRGAPNCLLGLHITLPRPAPPRPWLAAAGDGLPRPDCCLWHGRRRHPRLACSSADGQPDGRSAGVWAAQ